MGVVNFMYSTINKREINSNNVVSSSLNSFYYMDLLLEAVVIQRDDRIIYFNTSFINLININDRNKIIGEDFYDILGIDKENIQNIDSNKVLDIEIKSIKVKNFYGNDHDVEIKSTIKKDNHHNEEIIIIRDITPYNAIYEELQMKLAKDEMLLQKTIEYDKLKADFISNISHELRTPLNILLSSLQMLNIFTDNIDAKEIISIKNYLRIMKQNCYRLLRLVNNFIDVTKIDAGFRKLNSKNINIIRAVEEITSSVVEYMKNKNIEFIFDTEVEEKIVSCDEDKLERIILNLLSNAIKFTAPGGKIVVNIYDRDPNIIVSVKDTGIGIQEDKLKVIFDRFGQVYNTVTRENQGSGIGLNLAKSLVELHGGKIEVKSTYGLGTEFLIYLPVNKDESIYEIEENLSKEYEKGKESNIDKLNIEFSDIYLV